MVICYLLAKASTDSCSTSKNCIVEIPRYAGLLMLLEDKYQYPFRWMTGLKLLFIRFPRFIKP